MIKAHRISRCSGWPMLFILLMLCACTTPVKKPPTPKPIVSESEPHPRGLEGPSSAAPGGVKGGAGSPGNRQGYGAASANAAEVEEEEVAADGSTRVISSSQSTPAKAAAGGGSLPPSATAPQRATGSGGGGPKLDPQGPGTRYSDMQGVDLEDGKSTGVSTVDDASAEALRSGNPDGHIDGRGQRATDLAPRTDSAASRPGVRSGVDESGATLGTPSPAPIPLPTRTQATPRANDILAQQLREAAEQEKDPALREKLWAEYRKYKAGL